MCQWVYCIRACVRLLYNLHTCVCVCVQNKRIEVWWAHWMFMHLSRPHSPNRTRPRSSVADPWVLLKLFSVFVHSSTLNTEQAYAYEMMYVAVAALATPAHINKLRSIANLSVVNTKNMLRPHIFAPRSTLLPHNFDLIHCRLYAFTKKHKSHGFSSIPNIDAIMLFIFLRWICDPHSTFDFDSTYICRGYVCRCCWHIFYIPICILSHSFCMSGNALCGVTCIWWLSEC